jgi:hypothetical protein
MTQRPRTNGKVQAIPTNISTPLPDTDGPYELVIPEGSCPIFPNNSAHIAARDVAALLPGNLVMIRSQTGEIVRQYIKRQK